MQSIHTLIIGGGQAGLATSYYLQQHQIDHVVLEQAAQVGNAWRNGRWDSFTLVTPNWSIQMPGAPYEGNDPDGFLNRDQIVAYFERYVERFQLPVQYGVRVVAVDPAPSGGYRVTTDRGLYEARNVVLAVGLFQRPKPHRVSLRLPSTIAQIYSSQYRNPQMLPPGAVLVVGSGQSGAQIAEELHQSGRTVYLSVGSAGRVPRRYRGKDCFEWLQLTGFLDRTVDKLPSSKARFAGNPHVSGKGGGHSLNLHQFARDGVRLLGHLTDIQDDRITLAYDLKESLAKADQLEIDLINMIDDFIEKNGLDAPKESLPVLGDGYAVEELRELDLKAAGVGTVVWATGYTFDFSWVKLPITDSDHYPIQQRGITPYPGLYVVGLHWLHKNQSGLLMGVGEDAEYIASHILSRNRTNGYVRVGVGDKVPA